MRFCSVFFFWWAATVCRDYCCSRIPSNCTHTEWRQIGRLETKEVKKKTRFLSLCFVCAMCVSFSIIIYSKLSCWTFTTWLREGYFNLFYFDVESEWGTHFPERRVPVRLFLLLSFFFWDSYSILYPAKSKLRTQNVSEIENKSNWNKIEMNSAGMKTYTLRGHHIESHWQLRVRDGDEVD